MELEATRHKIVVQTSGEERYVAEVMSLGEGNHKGRTVIVS